MAVAEASRGWMRSHQYVDTLMKLKMSLVVPKKTAERRDDDWPAGSN